MDLVIHTGLPKTGTTTIQNHLLRRVPGYLGRSLENRDLIDKKHVIDLYKKSTNHRFLSPEDAQNAAQDFTNRIKNASKSKNGLDRLVLSDESLCRWPTVDESHGWWPVGHKPRKEEGQRERPMPFIQFLRDYLEPAWRPHGDVRIVINLRNQTDYLASLYAQVSKKRINASQSDFEQQIHKILDRDDPSINWNAITEDFEQVIGKDRLTVLLFEDMGHEKFWKDAGNAFGINDVPSRHLSGKNAPRENVKTNEKNTWIIQPSRFSTPSGIILNFSPENTPGRDLAVGVARRVLNPVFSRFLRSLIEPSRGYEIHMTEELRSRIRSHCAESNKKLAYRLTRDLRSLGY